MKDKRINEFQKINLELLHRINSRREQYESPPPNMHNNSALGIPLINNSLKNIAQISGIQYRKGSLKLGAMNQSLLQISTTDTIDEQHKSTPPQLQRFQIQKAKLKPIDLGDAFGIPGNRKVLFRRLAFTETYHKVYIEISKKKQKLYIIIKKYSNDKYKYHIHEMHWFQAQKILQHFDWDYQLMIDQTVKISTRKGEPPVDFSMIDKFLYNAEESPKNRVGNYMSRNIMQTEILEEQEPRRIQQKRNSSVEQQIYMI